MIDMREENKRQAAELEALKAKLQAQIEVLTLPHLIVNTLCVHY